MGITVMICEQCRQPLEEWEAGICEGCGMSTKQIRLEPKLISHIIGLLKESRRIRVMDSDLGRSIEIEFDGEPWKLTIDATMVQP